MSTGYDVFLSYRTEDPVGEWVREFFARELQSWLSEQFADRAGKVFYDRDSIQTGNE